MTNMAHGKFWNVDFGRDCNDWNSHSREWNSLIWDVLYALTSEDDKVAAALGTSQLIAVSDRLHLAWPIPTSLRLRLLANGPINYSSACFIIGSCSSLVHLASCHRLNFWVIWFYDKQRKTTKMQMYRRTFRVLAVVSEMQDDVSGTCLKSEFQVSQKLPVRGREQCLE